VKATPAFNSELCRRHKVPPLEFNGREDSLFQAYNLENQKFMEYLEFSGIYADIPLDHILAGWRKTYGDDRVESWIKMFEKGGGPSLRDFDREDVLGE
jgi:hypothetical protein